MIQDGSIGLGVKFEAVLATSMSARDTSAFSHVQETIRPSYVAQHLSRHSSNVTRNDSECRRVEKGWMLRKYVVDIGSGLSTINA